MFSTVARPFVLAVLSIGLLLMPAVALGDGSYTILDRTKVYYGRPNSFQKPAVVKFARVTTHISEYRKIKEKGLKPSDAEYLVLAQEGTKRFRRTVKEVAKKKGFDLVVEVDNIVPPSGVVVPELTNDVIKKLGGTP